MSQECIGLCNFGAVLIAYDVPDPAAKFPRNFLRHPVRTQRGVACIFEQTPLLSQGWTATGLSAIGLLSVACRLRAAQCPVGGCPAQTMYNPQLGFCAQGWSQAGDDQLVPILRETSPIGSDIDGLSGANSRPGSPASADTAGLTVPVLRWALVRPGYVLQVLDWNRVQAVHLDHRIWQFASAAGLNGAGSAANARLTAESPLFPAILLGLGE